MQGKLRFGVRQGVIGIGLATLLAACGSSSASSGSSTTAGSTASTAAGPILIGLATPLTGGAPSEGRSEEQVANDFVSKINSSGGIDGRQVKLIIRDTQMTPTGAVSSYESLVSAGVQAVVGEFTSTAFQAACAVAQQEKVVLIGHASATQGLTDGKTYCFRDEYQINQASGAMFGVAKANHWNPIAIATDTSSFGAGENQSWSALAGQYGIKIATNVTWGSPAATLTAQVLNIAHSGAKAVFVGSPSGADVTLLASTMVQLGVKIPIFGPGGVNGPGIVKTAGPSYSQLPGVYNITSYDSAVPKEAAFMANLATETGLPQGGGNMTRLQDAFGVIATALQKTHGQGGLNLVNALQTLGKYPTLSGGPGTYIQYSPTVHSGLFGPNLLTVYKWSPASNSFLVDQSLSSLANSAPGVN